MEDCSLCGSVETFPKSIRYDRDDLVAIPQSPMGVDEVPLERLRCNQQTRRGTPLGRSRCLHGETIAPFGKWRHHGYITLY
jgi:hypothetical protein